MRSRTGLIPLAAFVVVAAVAGAVATAGRSSSSAAPPPVGQQALRLAAASAAQASPRQVRAQFEQLLGLHALLAVRQMRSVVATAPELQRATEASLQANTDAWLGLGGCGVGNLDRVQTTLEALWRFRFAGSANSWSSWPRW